MKLHNCSFMLYNCYILLHNYYIMLYNCLQVGPNATPQPHDDTKYVAKQVVHDVTKVLLDAA